MNKHTHAPTSISKSLWLQSDNTPLITITNLLIIVFFGLLAFGPSLLAGFMIDDHICITNRPELQGWSWAKVTLDFSTTIFGIQGVWGFRPLQTLISRLLINLFGENPIAFHAVTLLFHLGTALLLWKLTQLLHFSRRIALMTSLLFVVNPIGMDQFLQAVGLNDPLSYFFMTLAAFLILRGTGWRNDFYCCCAGLLAIMSKESGVLFPFLLILVVFFRDKHLPSYRSLLMWFTTVFLYVLIFKKYLINPVSGLSATADVIHFVFYALPHIILHYVGLILFPWQLYFFKMVPARPLWWMLSTVLLIVLSVLAFRKKGVYLFGYIWFFLFFLPKVPLMFSYGFMLDHYAYPSTYGMFLALSVTLDQWWGQKKKPFLAAGLFVLLLYIGLFSSVIHFTLRGSEEKNLRWCLRFVSPPSLQLHFAALLIRTQRPELALPILVSLWNPATPNRAIGYDLAMALAYMNRRQESRNVLHTLLRQWPRDPVLVQALCRVAPPECLPL